MKKILIINNNLDMGGIQKSLINLLLSIHKEYDITLLLFSKSGSLINEIPDDVKVVTPNFVYRILGLSKDQLKSYPILFIFKALLIKYASLFSRRSAMKILGFFQKKIKGYDIAISYSHLPDYKYFNNGCGDFVLDKIQCSKKICLIHCDYLNGGYMSIQNNNEYKEFDKIVCCSESVRRQFLKGSKIDKNKVFTLRNFYDLRVLNLARENPYCYDNNYINILTVARLSVEKGIDRAIDAIHDSERQDIRYYIIGDGPQKNLLKDKVFLYQMENQVFFVGEKQNPYRYMLNADYLLVPSIHEAAPMVIDEAKILGLKILSTKTTSAMEMITIKDGIVCNNSQKDIENMIINLKKSYLENSHVFNNDLQKYQFELIINN